MSSKEPRWVGFLKSLADLCRCLGVDKVELEGENEPIASVVVLEKEGSATIRIFYYSPEAPEMLDSVECVVRRDGGVSCIIEEELRHYTELAMKDEEIRNAVEILRMSCKEINNLLTPLKKAHEVLEKVFSIASRLKRELVLPCRLRYDYPSEELYVNAPPSISVVYQHFTTSGETTVDIIYDHTDPTSGYIYISVEKRKNGETTTNVRTSKYITGVRDISGDVKKAEEVLECIIRNYSGGEEEIKRKIALAILYP